MKAPKSIKLPPGVDPNLFASPLDKPIRLPALLAVVLISNGASEAVHAELHKIKSEMVMERLILLGERLGIEKNHPNFWFLLAFALAKTFVPGLREADPERRGRGRPRDSEGIDLLRAVEEMVHRNPRMGVEAACEQLVKKREKWKGKKPKSLAAKYHLIKKQLFNFYPAPSDAIWARLLQAAARAKDRKTQKKTATKID
jgi:hypothetical protein